MKVGIVDNIEAIDSDQLPSLSTNVMVIGAYNL